MKNEWIWTLRGFFIGVPVGVLLLGVLMMVVRKGGLP